MATLKKGGTYGQTAISEELLAASTVSVTYVPVGAANAPLSEARPAQSVAIALAPTSNLPAVPGSVIFAWMGHDYSDNGQGIVFRGAAVSPPGVQSGVMNYATCTAVLDDWIVGPNPQTITLKRLWTRKQRWTTGVIYGRTASAPIKPGAGGMTLTATTMAGESITATVDGTGEISGPEATGAIDLATGAYQVMYGSLVPDASLSAAEKSEWWYDAADVGAVEAGKIWRPVSVDPTSIRYNAITFTYLPIDAELMGVTPERLRPDGRAPFVRPGDYCVIGATITGPAHLPVVGATYDIGTTLLSSIDVLDADGGTGQVADGYTQDLDAGTMTITDITGWPAQIIVRGRAEVYRRVAFVGIDGTVRLTMPVGRAFPVGSVLSTAMRFSNKQAYVERLFDQYTWDKTSWSNIVSGNGAPGSYDDTGHPVEVNNLGCITQRWAFQFRVDGVTFDCYGEKLGLLGSGTVNADFVLPNPNADNAPYLILRALGWSGGWIPGNTLFVHTVGAEMSFGLVRSISPGSPVGIEYEALLELRGGSDRPPSNPFA
jgi:hypothetical protein